MSYTERRDVLRGYLLGGVMLLLGASMACQKPATSADTLLALPQADCAAALWTEDLGTWLADVEMFIGKLLGPQQQALWTRAKEALQTRLGANPLDVKIWQQAGVRTQAGALLFLSNPQATPQVALRIDKPNAFDTALVAMFKRYDGTDLHTQRNAEGFTVHSLSRPFGDAAVSVLSWAHLPPYVLIETGTGAQLPATLSRLSQKETSPGLARDARFTAAMARVPRAGVRIFERLGGEGDSRSASLALTGKGIDMQSFAGQGTQALAALYRPPALSPLLQGVPHDAALLALSQAVRPEVFAAWTSQPLLGPLIARAVSSLQDESGLDVREVLPTLRGDVTASVSLRRDKIAGRNLQQMRQALAASVILGLAAPKPFAQILQKGHAALGKRGVHIVEKRTPNTATLFAPKGATTMGWGIWRDVYVYAWGEPGVADTLTRLRDGTGALDKAELWAGPAGQLQEGAAGLVVLRGKQLGAAVQDVGQTALGPRVGQFTSIAAAVLRTLGDVALAVYVTPEGVRLRVLEVLP